MERFVASAPNHVAASRPSVSPMSVPSPASLRSLGLAPIPFSAIRSSSDDPKRADLNLSPHQEEILSESDLIARGRALLAAYQTQKKQWASQNSKSGVPESENAPDFESVNIFQHVQEDVYSSPTVPHLTAEDAPSIDTKLLDNLLLPPPPPPSTAFSNFSIGPTPTSELKVHEPVSVKTSEKSWTDFMELLKSNSRMMDVVDEQLGQIWGELVAADQQVRGPQSSVDKFSEAVAELLQQKREAELAISKLAEVLGSRVFLTGKMTDDAVQFVSNQLRLELEASQALVERVNQEKREYMKEFTSNHVNGKAAAMDKLLRQQLQDKDGQLKASQAAVAKLKAQMQQQKEADAKKLVAFERALDVKLREVEALCSDVPLPTTHERVKTVEGVDCFRRKNGEDELEDPRVSIAIKKRTTQSNVASITADGAPTSTSNDVTSSGSVHRPRGVSALARDYAAPDNMMRRSFSTPHISHDSSVFEDIHVPPDDGFKHTIDDFSTPLPAGWEMRVTASGAVFFFNKYTTTTTWTDPRLLGKTPSSSSSVENASNKLEVRNSSAATTDSRLSRSNSTAVHINTLAVDDGVTHFDVVFNERGPIGIHFQANVPDAGATVRSILPDMAAESKGVLEPFDELVAVNKNPVDAAPFRHVMLLLQGGLRPLTLTFKRDPNRPVRPVPPIEATQVSEEGASSGSESDTSDIHPDEEVVVDEGMVVDLDQLRVPTESSPQRQAPPQSQATGSDEEDDMNVADVIITNIFSLFWRPPEAAGEVQTV